jgi:hypothetical protein
MEEPEAGPGSGFRAKISSNFRRINDMSEFEYKILKPNEIRRVTLHPGSGDESLLCSLTVAKVGDAGYEAVPYVWGETNRSIRVLCNYGKAWDVISDDGRAQSYELYDINADKCVRAIRNLHSALLDLRGREGYRNLWIDSICINQDDHQERHNQVLLMRLIYRK